MAPDLPTAAIDFRELLAGFEILHHDILAIRSRNLQAILAGSSIVQHIFFTGLAQDRLERVIAAQRL